ncbi:MAG: ABC transporter permease [Deltaproteobacteria bacterium]|nr:ABC transporter permease [Deltaproteobacteria bacterium]
MGLSTPVRQVGRLLVGASRETGGAARLLVQIGKRLVPPQMDRSELRRCLLRMGYKSLSIIVATAFVVGVILVIQAFVFVDRYGLRSQLGWGAGFVTVRELGPILFALMFSGRVGAYTAAELGTMQVTDQVDGLRCLAIDPISYLVVPRFVAMIVALVCLTVIGNAVALVSASVMGQILMEVDQHTFWSSLTAMLTPWDFFTSVFKSAFFGAIIAVTSCYYGLATTGGAPGVGRAVNRSVVASAAAIFVVDYFSTFVLG